MSVIDDKVAHIEQILGYTFADKLLCVEALQMAAPQALVIIGGQSHDISQNRRLAVLGDIVLTQYLCKLWYRAPANQGGRLSLAAWTTLRNEILGNVALSHRGEELGIPRWVIMSGGILGLATPKMVATAFEALAGALYEDGGEEALTHIVKHLQLDRHPLLSIPCAEEFEDIF